ncbi:MAG: hypothetical protein HQK51_12630 [Oligoflexia bacterium]|nr:hypothetical protein [Oligoflexia bacterium]
MKNFIKIKKRLFISKFMSVALAFTIGTQVVLAGGWHQSNDPERMKLPGMDNFEFNIDKLMKKKSNVLDVPPSDGYWATYLGGVSRRILDESFSDKAIKESDLYTLEQLRKISKKNGVIDTELSPIEKVDLFLASQSKKKTCNFPLTKAEIARCADTASKPEGKKWMGLCHNLNKMGLYKKEAKPFNAKCFGMKVHFNTSDINGLNMKIFDILGAVGEKVCDESFCGTRCNKKIEGGWDDPVRDNYNDVNAATFFLSTVNTINQGMNLVFDRTTDEEVWNQPVYGYTIKDLGVQEKFEEGYDDIYVSTSRGVRPVHQDQPIRTQANGTVKEQKIRFTVNWLNEIGPHAGPQEGDSMKESSTFDIILELDKDNKIVGGRYAENTSKYPDFIWNDNFKKERRNKPIPAVKVKSTNATEDQWEKADSSDSDAVDLDHVNKLLDKAGLKPKVGREEAQLSLGQRIANAFKNLF